MSNDKYRSQIIQPLINQIARLIDYGLPCIATQTYGQIHGGHFISVGANRTIALNLHNIHRQSAYSNTYNHGDTTKYKNGLIQDYSHNYLNFIEQLQQTPTLNLSKNDLKEIHQIAKSIIKELKQFIKTLSEPISPQQRIYLRNLYNQQLNIYPTHCAIYSINHYLDKI
jgi:6-pyruvoyl-tetrahydropterin synthase